MPNLHKLFYRWDIRKKIKIEQREILEAWLDDLCLKPSLAADIFCLWTTLALYPSSTIPKNTKTE